MDCIHCWNMGNNDVAVTFIYSSLTQINPNTENRLAYNVVWGWNLVIDFLPGSSLLLGCYCSLCKSINYLAHQNRKRKGFRGVLWFNAMPREYPGSIKNRILIFGNLFASCSVSVVSSIIPTQHVHFLAYNIRGIISFFQISFPIQAPLRILSSNKFPDLPGRQSCYGRSQIVIWYSLLIMSLR